MISLRVNIFFTFERWCIRMLMIVIYQHLFGYSTVCSMLCCVPLRDVMFDVTRQLTELFHGSFFLLLILFSANLIPRQCLLFPHKETSFCGNVKFETFDPNLSDSDTTEPRGRFVSCTCLRCMCLLVCVIPSHFSATCNAVISR